MAETLQLPARRLHEHTLANAQLQALDEAGAPLTNALRYFTGWLAARGEWGSA